MLGSIRAEDTPFNDVLCALQTWHKSHRLASIKGVFSPLLEQQNRIIQR